MIKLEVDIIDQRRCYRVSFATEDQAIDFINRKHATGNHVVSEYALEDGSGSAGLGNPRLSAVLYPQCEHGLSLALCMGPQHYPTNEQEMAMTI